MLSVPIGIRGVVPILILVLRPVRAITIAIVSIVGGLILRIEAIVTCKSSVIILDTELSFDHNGHHYDHHHS